MITQQAIQWHRFELLFSAAKLWMDVRWRWFALLFCNTNLNGFSAVLLWVFVHWCWIQRALSAVLVCMGFQRCWFEQCSPNRLTPKAWQHEYVNELMVNCLFATMLVCVLFWLVLVRWICMVLSVTDMLCWHTRPNYIEWHTLHAMMSLYVPSAAKSTKAKSMP